MQICKIRIDSTEPRFLLHRCSRILDKNHHAAETPRNLSFATQSEKSKLNGWCAKMEWDTFLLRWGTFANGDICNSSIVEISQKRNSSCIGVIKDVCFFVAVSLRRMCNVIRMVLTSLWSIYTFKVHLHAGFLSQLFGLISQCYSCVHLLICPFPQQLHVTSVKN